MKLKIITTIVLLSGFVLAAYTFLPGRDMKIVTEDYATIDGVRKVTGRTVRTQKANGDATEVKYFINPYTGEDMGHQTHVYIAGRRPQDPAEFSTVDGGKVQNKGGVYKLLPNEQELMYVSERPATYRPSMDEQSWRASPLFAGEGVVAGYRVLGLKSENGGLVFWRAPDLNGALLRVQCFTGCPDSEAVSVELGKFPDPDPLPNWPITFDAYRQKIEKTKAVNPKVAEHMEKALQ